MIKIMPRTSINYAAKCFLYQLEVIGHFKCFIATLNALKQFLKILILIILLEIRKMVQDMTSLQSFTVMLNLATL